jgi:hypothetical protein
MRQRRGDFYIYQQHDDLISPTYIADLVNASQTWQEAVLFYSKLKFTGRRSWEISVPSLLGEPKVRVLNYLSRLDWVPFRGLIRSSALEKTSGLLLSDFDPFDSMGTEQRFLTELSRVGEFRLVEGPTYYKSWHRDNLSIKRQDWPRDRRVTARACFAAWMIEVIAPIGTTVEERRHLFNITLDRFAGSFSKQIASVMRNQPRVNVLLRLWDQLKNSRQPATAISNMLPVPFGAKERTNFLLQVFQHLKRGGRLDANECLNMAWDDLEGYIFDRYRIDR